MYEVYRKTTGLSAFPAYLALLPQQANLPLYPSFPLQSSITDRRGLFLKRAIHLFFLLLLFVSPDVSLLSRLRSAQAFQQGIRRLLGSAFALISPASPSSWNGVWRMAHGRICIAMCGRVNVWWWVEDGYEGSCLVKITAL